jgi:hypothetical protein
MGFQGVGFQGPLYFGFTAQAGRQRVPPSDGHIAAQHVLLHYVPL